MIRKHIDLIAIGVLLCGFALYSGVRHTMILTVISHHRAMAPHFRPPVLVMPEVPRIPFTRD